MTDKTIYSSEVLEAVAFALEAVARGHICLNGITRSQAEEAAMFLRQMQETPAVLRLARQKLTAASYAAHKPMWDGLWEYIGMEMQDYDVRNTELLLNRKGN